MPPVEFLFTVVRCSSQQSCWMSVTRMSAWASCCVQPHCLKELHSKSCINRLHDPHALCVQDEETGLNGAKALDNAALQITARKLVNMDSEEWGEVCIGCAGGGHSAITLPAPTERVPPGCKNAARGREWPEGRALWPDGRRRQVCSILGW
jgi:hypothetical protein